MNYSFVVLLRFFIFLTSLCLVQAAYTDRDVLSGDRVRCNLQKPDFSHEGGRYEDSFSLKVRAEQGEGVLYTTDGSTPMRSRIRGEDWSYKSATRNGEKVTRQMKTFRSEREVSISLGRNASDRYRGARVTPNHGVGENPVSGVTVVRARSYKEGCKPGRVVTKTYFVGLSEQAFDVPLVSIAVDPDGLFSHDDGIYVIGRHHYEYQVKGQSGGGLSANYRGQGREFRRTGNVEVFGSDGSVLNQSAEIGIHGDEEREMPMKSLRVRFQDVDSGAGKNISMDQESDTSILESIIAGNQLILHNGGYPDGFKTVYRSGLVSDLVHHRAVDIPRYELAAHFINGEFWGMIGIRRPLNAHYLSDEYGIAPEIISVLDIEDLAPRLQDNDIQRSFPGYSIDEIALAIIQGEKNMKFEGVAGDYISLLQFAVNKDLSRNDAYDRIRERMDVYNYARYAAVQIYINNQQWPENGVVAWKPEAKADFSMASTDVKDGRWRWAIDRADKALLSHHLTGRGRPLADSFIADVTSPEQGPSPEWSTALFRNLLENDEFRAYFLGIIADLSNAPFRPERVVDTIKSVRKESQHLRKLHASRWPLEEEDEVWTIVEEYLASRDDAIRDNVMKEFGIESLSRIVILMDEHSLESGYVTLNSIAVKNETPGVSLSYDDAEDAHIWGGVYFQGIPIWIQAIPKDRFRFSAWEEEGFRSSTIVFTPKEEYHRFTPLFESVSSN